MLARSRDLLGALATSTKSDTWYLETAVYLLLATLGWLIFRRWLYGPLWLFVGLPVRGIWWVGKGLVKVGTGGGPGKASMGIVGAGDGQKTIVDMQDGEAVPTVSVGRTEDRKGAREQADPDSMVEKVARIVDGEDQQQADNSSGDQPNTMKRMWEEKPTDAATAEAGPPRDEL
jgi:protein transport protein SEC20